jgi:asparagine synthase (glutamine-hydrolysing)
MYRDCADVRLARQIANTTRQPHQVISITNEFLTEFPALAERSIEYTDGAMDITGAVELFANRVGRGIAPVRLTGNYGSEVLRGNVAFKPVSLSTTAFAGEFVSALKQAGETYAREKAIPRTQFIISKQVPWHHFARLAVEQSQLTVRSPFLDNELVRLAYQAPDELSVNRDLAYRFIADCDPALARIPNDRGIELRPGASASKFKVFCQEFMPRVEYVFDYGMPPWLAKIDRWLMPLHPERLFLGRQKFYHFRVWYRDRLSKYVQEVLLDPRSLGRPHINRRGVEQLVSAHVTGRGNFTTEIHKLLTSELIHRRLLEQH